MSPRRTRSRAAWRQTSKGTWTLSFGEYGHRVRLFQNRKDGSFYREVRVNGQKDRVSLHTRDREEAERIGRTLSAALAGGTLVVPPTPLRLGELVERFTNESPTFLDNVTTTQRDQRRQGRVLVAAFGSGREVRTFTENDVRHFEALRKRGGIVLGQGRVTRATRQRSVQAEIKLLKTMLYWACTQVDAAGRRLLESNPLQYVRVAGERDVKRPVSSFGRYQTTREAMQRLQATYSQVAQSADATDGERARAERRRLAWVRGELALMLMEATGRRRGAVAGLRWEDFDHVGQRITWRAEFDKKRRTWVVPYPSALFDEVRDFQRKLGAAGGFLFPRHDDPSQPAPRELISQKIAKAEKDAGLPKLDGGLCHPFRRKWRSERPHHAIKAVAEAGGWSDTATMLQCYDHPEDADVLAVTSEPRKRGVASVA